VSVKSVKDLADKRKRLAELKGSVIDLARGRRRPF